MLLVSAALAAAAATNAFAQARQPAPSGQAQPSRPSSQGENFSAGKPPGQLFASDCTGAGCHRGPQGLATNRSAAGLASFLREHYTNSRESAAALAGYLAALPAARQQQQQQPEQPPGRTPRTAARPGEEVVRPAEEIPPAGATRRAPGQPAEAEAARPAAPPPAAATPAARAQRGRTHR